MKKSNLTIMLLLSLFFLNSCATSGSSTQNASFEKESTAPSVTDQSLWKKSSNTTWQTLEHTPLPKLVEEEAANSDPNAKGWLSLAIISKQYSSNTAELIKQLQNWRTSYPSHPANELIPNNSLLDQILAQGAPKHIALLLPLHGPMAASGQIVRSGFLSAYYDNLGQDTEKQAVSFYDTNETDDIGSLYLKAKEEGADLIVGPLTKAQVEALRGLNHFDVRVLALNYTQVSFFKSLPTNFYEFGLSPESEAKQLADKAHRNGHVNALIIASDNAWGHRVTDALQTEWNNLGSKVSDILYYGPQTNLTQAMANFLHINPQEDRELMKENNNKAALSEQRRKDFDVIFIFAQPEMGRQIVPMLKFYYAGNIPVYSISAIYSGRPNPSKDKDLNGVTFCEIPSIIQMSHSPETAKGHYDRLYAVGLDAYLLSQTLSRLDLLPNFPIYGATGALKMDQQQIYQRLPWVTMHGGQI